MDCLACGRANSEFATHCGGCGQPLPFQYPGNARAVPPALVGRQRELEVLLTSLGDVFAGRGVLAMLVGEAGVGKTRIAQELGRRAAGMGATVLWGSCLEGDWQPAYGPWVEAMGEYARGIPPERLREMLGPAASPLAKLVPQIRADLPEVPEPAPLGADEERVRIYDAVIQLLMAVARETPLILVIDDLHWADRDSLRLLRYLTRFLARYRAMVVAAYREPERAGPHPLDELLPVLRRETDYRQVTVRGLSREEVAEYLSQAAGKPLPGALTQAIHRETGGNPFYVREVFRHLSEEGKILIRDGRWSTDFSIGEMGIPAGVREVVHRRLSRLSTDANSVLRIAAGFTSGFEFSTLRVLSGLTEDALLDCIDEALQAGLLAVARAAPPAYDFVHAIVRHTLYDELNPDRRARLQRRIANALLEAYSGQEMKHAAEIAAQYHASRSLPGAANGVWFALAAAEQARATYAHERAVTFLRMARDLATERGDADRAQILCDLAIAEAQAVMPAEARRSAEAALAVLEAAGAGSRARAEFLMTISRALKDGGVEPAVWGPMVEQGLALAGERRDLLWARLMLLRESFEPVSTSIPAAVRWLAPDPEAVAIARDLGDEDDYARTLSLLSWRTREETDALLALVRTWEHPSAVMRGLSVVTGDLVEHHSAFREAVELIEELHRTSLRCGSLPGQAEATYQLGAVKLLLGEMVEGQQVLRQARELIPRLGSVHRLHLIESAPLAFLAYYLDIGWDLLERVVTDLPALVQSVRSHYGLASIGYQALLLSRIGKEEEARKALDILTPIAERMEPRMHVHNVVVTMGAGAVWDLRAVEFAGSYERMARNLIEAAVGGGPLSPNELAVARMAALRGDMEQGDEYFARARSLLDVRSMHHLRAVVDYDEALAHLRAGSTDRDRMLALLDAALKTFRALGMNGWVDRALGLKEELAVSEQPAAGCAVPAAANSLTMREVEVLRLLSIGRTNYEIAQDLVLSPRTVERHIANIYGKIGVHSRVGATTFALTNGIASVPGKEDGTG